MKTKIASIFILVLGLAYLGSVPRMDAETPETRNVALVTFRVGDVQLIRDGKEEPLRVRSLVKAEDRIKTGKDSRVIVQFSQDAFISIQENTDIAVGDIHYETGKLGFLIRLFSGRMGVDAQRNKDKYDIRVEGPTVVALVRGTTFMVEAEERQTRVLVSHGQVDVEGPGDAQLAVRSGEKVQADDNGLQKSIQDQFDRQRLQILEQFRDSKARNFEPLIKQIQRNEELMQKQNHSIF
ncbi:MAG: FecR domain-containing protein [Leptospiraceae bacterium]|nr:FecR domain-containing protein [Leptospiraceae bacterium]